MTIRFFYSAYTDYNVSSVIEIVAMIYFFSNYSRLKSSISKCVSYVSCVMYNALFTMVPYHIIDELIKVQTNFIWKNTSTKIKPKTLMLD